MLSNERCLSKAFKEEDKGVERKDIFFISLFGADLVGKPDSTKYVYDIISTEYEFTPTRPTAKALDVPKLLTLNNEKKTTKMFSEPTVYDLARFFIKSNRRAHYILDEIRIFNGKSIL